MESDWSVQTVPFFCPMTDDHVCSRRLVIERGDLEKTKTSFNLRLCQSVSEFLETLGGRMQNNRLWKLPNEKLLEGHEMRLK